MHKNPIGLIILGLLILSSCANPALDPAPIDATNPAPAEVTPPNPLAEIKIPQTHVNNNKTAASSAASQKVPIYTYNIVNRYPHDGEAFTQGLVFEDGFIYEGTGIWGKSSLRKIELETGAILEIYEIPDQYFGEGVTIFQDIIVQLTWKSNLGFVYDKRSFQPLYDFTYSKEGWGITVDGQRFIMSDGTSTLYFLELKTFDVIGHIDVYENDVSIGGINELEYVNGLIYANIHQTDNIVIINPDNGRVSGWINLSGLLQPQDRKVPVGVLNGIAYDDMNNRIFVTGKRWPWLFEIELIIKE
ncbi:glutaminyl-peptide cyclotransferase [Bacteroidota bacterium]